MAKWTKAPLFFFFFIPFFPVRWQSDIGSSPNGAFTLPSLARMVAGVYPRLPSTMIFSPSSS